MSRLEEIALEYGLCNCDEAYKSRNLTAPDCPFHSFAIDEAMKLYAEECIKASLEKADKAYKNIAVKSINTALKYFEENKSNTIYKRDIISFLHAFHQFEAQGLSIVGLGYKRYDNKEITDLNGAYEGGYFTEEKKYQITNPENIVLL